MRYSINLPAARLEPVGEFQTLEAVQQIARAIEASGADACWVDDHPAPDAEWLRDPRGHDAIDPFVVLSMAAAVTTRLKVHTNVLVLPYRNPFLTAKAVATLETLTGGRTILGVGGGYLEGEFKALGVEFRKRGALVDESLETMMLAWSGEEVVKTGLTFDAQGILARPSLARPPAIWIGGAADKAIERVVKWGTGWCPFFGPKDAGEFRKAQAALSSLDDLRARVTDLRERLDAAGRSDPVDVCVNLLSTPMRMDRVEADKALESVAALTAAGATWVFTGFPAASRAAYLEFTTWFGEEVIARSR
jgi:probable F420-dependent oxidoreductase